MGVLPRFGYYLITRSNIALGLNALLELAFIVEREPILLDLHELLFEEFHHEYLGDLHPFVEIDCRDQRLECVGQQRVAGTRATLLFALAQANKAAET